MATLKELEAQVNKLDAALKKTEASARKTQEKMASGDWGVQQLKAFQSQLDKFNASIARNEAKKLKLIDQQATRDFEILNKQIQTVMKNLNQLNGDKARVGGTLHGRMSDDFRAIEVAIKNAERALASFQSRQFTQYNAAGQRKGVNNAGPFGPVDMDARLGPRNPQYTYADADLQSRIGPNRSGRQYSPYTGPFAGYANRTQSNYVSGGVDGVATAENNAAFNALTGSGVTKQLTDKEKLILKLKEERAAWIAANKAMLEYAKTQGIKDPEKAYRSTLLGGANGAYDISTFKERNAMGELNTLKVKSDKQGQLSNLQPQKSQQSFGQGITKDIGDLLKWSVAIAAIYGPITAMSEAMTQLIANEVKLATVSIALNENVAGTNKVFKDVDAAARRSGETITGVIDAFGAAYTATGRIANEYQRYNATVKLLDDSLVLSKLSTLDQAGAIDVLTAALYQTAKAPTPGATGSDTAMAALSRGTDLIDQWVQVSKVASVTVETLATGVAVLGDSAETAGLSIEQMNAMIATLSEVSLSSGKETANIAKALIGNYQQPTAVKELNRLGIAVVDTTGKTRQFLEVMRDVASLRSAKLIGDEDFSRLTLALGGGGIRRQKDVSAFIENFGRMEQLSGMQGGAGGASQAALGKQLDTVSTSATNLSNSLTGLAQTLGNEGGLLEAMSSVLKVGTMLVDVFDKISGFAGKAGPLLMMAGVVKMMTMGMTQDALTSKLATNVTNPMSKMMGYGAITGQSWAGKLTGQQSMAGVGGMSNFGLPSALALALPAIQSLQGGKPEEALGGLAGGVIGSLVSYGSPIGILIGNAAGEAMVRAVTYDSAFSDFFAGVNKPKEAGKASTVTDLDSLGKEAFKSMGFGNAVVGEYMAKLATQFQKIGLGGKEVKDAGGTFKTPEAMAMYNMQKTDKAAYDRMQFEYAKQGSIAPGDMSSLSKRQLEISNTPGTKDRLEAMQKEEAERLRKGLIRGDIKQADYGNRVSNLSAFAVTAPRVMAGMESEIGGVGDAFKSVEEAYKAYLDIASSGNAEIINGINSQLAEIDSLQNLIDKWVPDQKNVPVDIIINGVKVPLDYEGAVNAKGALEAGFGKSVKSAGLTASLQGLDLKNPIGGMQQASTQSDVAMIAQRAAELDKVQYANIEKDKFAALKDSWEPLTVLVEDLANAGKTFIQDVKVGGENVSASNYSAAKAQLEAEGKLTTKSANGIDWQVGSATAAQYRSAESRAPAFTKMLEDKGYKSKVEDAIITTSDKQTIVAHGDQKVIQYLLQQILDTEKKQLQGVWNLPEGSSFWVPLQSMIDTAGGGDGAVTPGEDGKKAKEVNPADLSNTTKEDFFKKLNMTPRGSVAEITKEDYLNQFSSARGMTGSTELEQSRHKQMLGFQESGASGGAAPSMLDQLITKVMSMFTPGVGALSGLGAGAGQGLGAGALGKGFKPSDNGQAITQTRMDIKLTSTTNLMVDGRVLASIVKPYLASDLMKTNESGGTITRSYVI